MIAPHLLRRARVTAALALLTVSTLVARAPRKLPEKQAAPADGSRGLLPLLFKGFR